MALALVARTLDGIRAPVLRFAATRIPSLRSAVRSRARRVELIAAGSIAVALVATLLAPALMFLWAPLVLGIPHLVADVRYLVVRAPVRVRWRDLVVLGLLAA